MIKAVIFDMDGVIINSEPAFQRIEKDMFREFGINMSDEEYMTYVGTNIVEMWAWIAEKHGVELDIDEVIAEEKRRYLTLLHSDQAMVSIDGVLELIEELHRANYILTIASSSSCEIIKFVTEKFGIENMFEAMISSDMVENSKPSPDIFIKTAEAICDGEGSARVHVTLTYLTGNPLVGGDSGGPWYYNNKATGVHFGNCDGVEAFTKASDIYGAFGFDVAIAG